MGTTALDATATAAVRRHLGRVLMEPLPPPATGLVSLDRTGRNPVLTAMTLDDAGMPAFARRTMPANGVPEDPAEAMRTVAALVSEGAFQGTALPMSEGLDWFGLRGHGSGVARLFSESFAMAEQGVAVDPALLTTTMDGAVARISAAVAGALDRDALHALRAIGEFGDQAYAFYAVAGEKRPARHQAAGAYPLLAAAFAGKLGLRMAIDSRRPLAEAMEKAFGNDARGRPRLPRPLQKRLQGVEWQDGGVPFEVIADTLSTLPPDWFPRNEPDWVAFLDLADTVFRRLPPIIGESPSDLAAGCGGKWAEFRRRVAKAAAPTRPPEDIDDVGRAAWRPVVSEDRATLSGVAVGVLDMVRHFRDIVALPVSASGSDMDVPLSEETRRLAYETSGRILCRGKSLPAIIELQRQWHTRSASINVAVRGEDTEAKDRERERKLAAGELRLVPANGWAPLCPVVVAPNGVTVMPLVSPQELVDEGRKGMNPDGSAGLSHCVGGYDDDCRKGTSHIVSFREYDGERFTRLSTAEFSKVDPRSNKLRLVQNQCHGNGTPPPRAQQAYNWFVHEVEAGNIAINRDGIMTFLMNHRRQADDITETAGYDRRNARIVDVAVGSWGPLMDKRFRGGDADALHGLPEMEALVEAVAPSFRRAPR